MAQPSFSLANSLVRSLVNYQPVRHKLWPNVRPIMGWPRPHLAKRGKKYPEPHTYHFRPYLPQDGSYTTRPLPIHKLGGRDLETGRVVVRTRGGGNPKKFRWHDMYRTSNEDGSPREERVLMLKYDPLASPRLALVADGERMRWIPASHGVEVGDIIRTYSEIPRNPIRAKDGDAHPVGALSVGTKIHLIEAIPGEGAKFCLAAGSFATITKRAADSVTAKLPSENSIKIERNCMAVVGQLSNIDCKHVKLWCPQRLRWLGFRPRSGVWRRKDGYCGRKIRPPKLMDSTLAALQERLAREKSEDIFNLD